MADPATSVRERQSLPWWFVFVRLWTTAPVLAVAVGLGYATGHLAIGGAAAAAFLVGGFGLSRWGRSNRARVRNRVARDPDYRQRHQERSDRLVRSFGLCLPGLGALLVIAVVAWVIAKLV